MGRKEEEEKEKEGTHLLIMILLDYHLTGSTFII